ncbi:hypothetical protein LCGC14_2599070 [marine sediment metagenome]|uniref:Uncharacterized protein n=1 Tax=marine sediment metagenome TaxID=412755 RepID=A0A0F9A9B6_9ZZZZ
MGRAMAGIVTKETLFTFFQKFLVITVDAVFADSEKVLDINLPACTLVNKVAGNEPEGVYIILGMGIDRSTIDNILNKVIFLIDTKVVVDQPCFSGEYW